MLSLPRTWNQYLWTLHVSGNLGTYTVTKYYLVFPLVVCMFEFFAIILGKLF